MSGERYPLAAWWWRELVEALVRAPSLKARTVDEIQLLARELAVVLEERGWELRRIGGVG